MQIPKGDELFIGKRAQERFELLYAALKKSVETFFASFGEIDTAASPIVRVTLSEEQSRLHQRLYMLGNGATRYLHYLGDFLDAEAPAVRDDGEKLRLRPWEMIFGLSDPMAFYHGSPHPVHVFGYFENEILARFVHRSISKQLRNFLS